MRDYIKDVALDQYFKTKTIEEKFITFSVTKPKFSWNLNTIPDFFTKHDHPKYLLKKMKKLDCDKCQNSAQKREN